MAGKRSKGQTQSDFDSDYSKSPRRGQKSPNTSSTSANSVGTEQSGASPPHWSETNESLVSNSSNENASYSEGTPKGTQNIYPNLVELQSGKEDSPDYGTNTLSTSSPDSSLEESYYTNKTEKERPGLGRRNLKQASVKNDFSCHISKQAPRKNDFSCHNSDREINNEHRNDPQPKPILYVNLIIIVSIMVAVACLIIMFVSSSSPEQKVERDKEDGFALFITEIKKLKPSFPSQSERLWRTVIASSSHVLKGPNSTYPSVIMLASQAQSPHLTFCLAEKVASKFLLSQNIDSKVKFTDVENLKHLDVHQQKLSLDNDIQSTFRSPDGRAYIIRNLQALSPEAALLLHGLCDGDNAPFKDVMIVLTLEIERTDPPKNAYQIEDYLTQLWTSSEVEYDKVSAIMSRILNNLVIITNEDSKAVRSVCA